MKKKILDFLSIVFEKISFIFDIFLMLSGGLLLFALAVKIIVVNPKLYSNYSKTDIHIIKNIDQIKNKSKTKIITIPKKDIINNN